MTVVLRGLRAYVPNPQHINLLWVLSHPERVSLREMALYDTVFAASEKLVRRYAADVDHPVELLQQCTDPSRFRPVPPDPKRRHEVLFVGNARGVRRSVAIALEAGIKPAVYGLYWDDLLPDGVWRGEHIPNDELQAVYVAAGVVLNDHWDVMRRDGLISNRVFDLTACGARVVSDRVDGMSEIFGDVVLTYDTPEEFAAAVKEQLNESPERRAAREQLSERIRHEHTFDARARILVEVASKVRMRST